MEAIMCVICGLDLRLAMCDNGTQCEQRVWHTIQDVRQTRADHFVEVLVKGRWYLAWQLEWEHTSTLPRAMESAIGERVHIRWNSTYVLQ